MTHPPSTLREWARHYQSLGFALARLEPGQKRPTNRDWTQFSYPAEKFTETDGLGLQAGRLSHDLVPIDIDDRDALADADRYLPPTKMEEGRPGKPRSHRFYAVKNIPPELTAGPEVAGGIGGPRTRLLKARGKGMIVEFKGTGSQVVVPPSLWTSKDGQHQERREWHSLGEPAVVDCRELFDDVLRLATAHGYVVPESSQKERLTQEDEQEEVHERLPLPHGEAARQARAYVAKMAPAVTGQGGNSQTFNVACVLVIDFGLTVDEALPLLMEFNARCCPPWPVQDLLAKLAAADQKDGPRGGKVRKRTRAITIHLGSQDEPVVVGVDASHAGTSYVDLAPSLWAALVKVGDRRELVAELAELPWQGKSVLLSPPSTIWTSKQEVWGEFFLANALRKLGAEVNAIRLPLLDGRRRTLATADAEWEVVEPPLHAWDAQAVAEEAGHRAKEMDRARKALPRDKPSPTLTKAVEFIRKHKVAAVTKEVVQKAKKRGISESTLRRGLQSYAPS